MGMINNIGVRLRFTLLFLTGVSLLALAGCKGDTTAPFGSSITIENLPTPTPRVTGTKSTTFMVTVFDPDGLPMSGVDVDLFGMISCSDFPSCAVIMANASGDTLTPLIGQVTTGDGGFTTFDVTAPTGALIAEILPPAPITLTTTTTSAATGLADGTYTYAVTAVNSLGEAFAGASGTASTTIVTSTSGTVASISLSWTAVTGAASYNVYNQQRSDFHNVTIPPFVDDGTPGPSGTYPTAAFNTTGGSSNRVTGTIQASSGATRASASVNF